MAERALATSQAESLWRTANRGAHETLLKILNDEGDAISTGGGEVTLDLKSLLSESSGQLGVAGKLASKIPDDAAQLTILKSDQLSMAQDTSKLVRKLPIVLTLLALFLYGLAVYLAGPRRRQALRSVGFGFIVAGVLALLLRAIGGSAVVDALAGNEAVKPAVEAVWSIGTGLLVTVAVSAITFGILVVIAAWLAGPTRIASNLRQEAAPYLRERRGTTYAVVGFIFLALILWAPVVAFHKPIGLLLLAVLMVLGTEALRRQTEEEFPDAGFGGAGERLRAAVPGRASGSPAPTAPAEESKVDQIERLSALKASGALSEDEFQRAKSEVLAVSPRLCRRPDGAAAFRRENLSGQSGPATNATVLKKRFPPADSPAMRSSKAHCQLRVRFHPDRAACRDADPRDPRGNRPARVLQSEGQGRRREGEGDRAFGAGRPRDVCHGQRREIQLDATATPCLELQAIEPTLNGQPITLEGLGEKSYTIKVTGSSGWFKIVNTLGVMSFPCEKAGKGGCPAGGRWLGQLSCPSCLAKGRLLRQPPAREARRRGTRGRGRRPGRASRRR